MLAGRWRFELALGKEVQSARTMLGYTDYALRGKGGSGQRDRLGCKPSRGIEGCCA
jgi:hypothetical protein